jgi:hypothetical protein
VHIAHDAKSFSDNGIVTIVVETKKKKDKIDEILLMQVLQWGSQHHFFPHVVITRAFK